MTIEIQRERQQRALRPDRDDSPGQPAGPRRIRTAIRFSTAVAGPGGIVLAAVDLASAADMRLLIAGVALVIVAALGAAVLCIDALLTDRGEFYRRGQLDGWMKGWRGQEPDAEDPLLK